MGTSFPQSTQSYRQWDHVDRENSEAASVPNYRPPPDLLAFFLPFPSLPLSSPFLTHFLHLTLLSASHSIPLRVARVCAYPTVNLVPAQRSVGVRFKLRTRRSLSLIWRLTRLFRSLQHSLTFCRFQGSSLVGCFPDPAMTEVSNTRLYLGNLPRNGTLAAHTLFSRPQASSGT